MSFLNKIKISHKLSAAFIMLALCTAAIMAWMSYTKARNILLSESEHRLQSTLAGKTVSLSTWMEGIKSDLQTQSAHPTTIVAVQEFIEGWNALPGDKTQYLKTAYIDQNPNPIGNKELYDAAPDGSVYSVAHKKHHGHFRKLLQSNGYYDAFLFDLQGNLVYSVYKEQDFATNLIAGEWAQSDLGVAFRDAKAGTSELHFYDFKAYAPSNDAPASFISKAIMNNGQVLGVMVYQMPVERLANIMQQSAGLGDTGEAYLVGADHFMRSDSKFSETSTILAQKIDAKSAIAALGGETGVITAVNYRGKHTVSAYGPLEIMGVKWAVIVEQEVAEMMAPILALKKQIMIQLGIAFAILSLLGFVFSRLITKPISMLVGSIDTLASGDLVSQIPYQGRGDELGEISNSMTTLRDNLSKAEVDSLSNAGMLKAIDANQVMVELKVDGTIIKANHNFLAATGYELEEIQGKHHSMFLSERARTSPNYAGFWKKMNAGESMSGEFEYFGKQGQSLWLSVSYTPVVDGAGKVFRIVNIANNVTKEHNARLLSEKQSASHAKDTATVVSTLAASLSALSEGDLTKSIDQAFNGEYEQLRLDFNRAVTKLNETMRTILTNSMGIQTGATELSQASEDLSTRTENQAAALEETAAALDEVTATVQQTAKSANQANTVVATTRGDAEKSGEVVREAVKAMSEIKNSSGEIEKIIGVIDEIAFQTNLLALNAGVEAARAGEAGRGFAVVASEVRALAQRSSDAAKDIKDLISTSGKHVDQGVELVNETGSSLEDIVKNVIEVSALVSDIATSAQEQATGLAEVNSAVNDMDRVTQQNAAMTEQSTAACHSLTNESEEMTRLVNQFQISGTVGATSNVQAMPTARPSPVAAQQEKAAAFFAASSQGSAALELEMDSEEDNDWQDF